MILKVPYYSQIKDTKKDEWKNKSCGVTALKMILDFYIPTTLSVDDLYQKGLDIDGFVEGIGWYHHSLALIAKSLGFRAITRSWNIPADALERLKSRGFEDSDIEIINSQQLDEGLETIKKELSNNHPMIVPLPKGLSKGGSGHLIVLIGFDEEGFIINDPEQGEKIKLIYSDFKKLWNRRAIMIYPA